jgi:Domain of Unknown Function (DUF1080)
MTVQSARLTALSIMLLPAAALALATQAQPGPSTLGAKPWAGATVLFDGKSLGAWVKLDGKSPADWPFADGILTVGKGNIMTRERFGNCQLHVEFNVPYMPAKHGQARGNSGVFLTGNHELQILDSYRLKLQSNDCGAIYKQVTPSANVCKPPLQWQTYDVTFHKAVVEGGKVVKKARVTVVQNGTTTIDNAEISITPGGIDVPAGQDGPVMLQDHGCQVEFRSLWIKPIG